MAIATGTHLGRYEIRSPIGKGGMGEVYLAWDSQLERKIALKILPLDVASDQQYALAHAQLAYAYAWMAVFIELDPVWVERAKQEVGRAESLDPQLAETHLARHLILWSAYEGFQIEAAIRELRSAQQLNPNVGHSELGSIYYHIGLEDQAGRELRRALEIDPTSEEVKESIVASYRETGRFGEALAAYQRFFDHGSGLDYYLAKSRSDDTQPALERPLAGMPNDPNNPWVRIKQALTFALKGEFRAAEAEIPLVLEKISRNRSYHHAAYEIARVYALEGKSQEAVKSLRETAAAGFPCYTLFERDPYLNRIRQAPEFIQFMAEMRARREGYQREFE